MRRPSRKDRVWPYCRTNTRMWWSDKVHGFHRQNGPAMEHDDGNKYWYVHGGLVMTDNEAGRDILHEGVPAVIEALMRQVYDLTERVNELEKGRA